MKKGPPNHPIFIGFSITEIYRPASYWGTPMESSHGPEVSSQGHSQIGDDHDRYVHAMSNHSSHHSGYFAMICVHPNSNGSHNVSGLLQPRI